MNENPFSFLWDAETYDKVSDIHEVWARKIISSKTCTGKETIMDAGCGSGRITKILIEIVPFGKVYAIDNDQNMIKKAKDNLKGFKNVNFIQSNLLDIDLNKIQSKFNIIFSNAVLHWILDHYIVFKNFYDLLLADGQLLIQCGGYGNLQKDISTFNIVKDSAEFKAYFSKWKDQWNFAKPVDTENILKEIGYRYINVYLEDYPVTFEDKKSYSIYLKTVVLGPYLKYLPSEKLQDSFLQRIIKIKEKESTQESILTLDYKRLNIFASR
ncbi:MAG: methyltransferase domain-containing protein [Thermoproteota archaeon]|nr:methyltransferase domain-containing protein [Thermoproteota archaeon]